MELTETSQQNLRYWDLKQRLYVALQHGWPGMAGAEAVDELAAIVVELERLLAPGALPPFVEAQEIERGIADAEFQLAVLCSWLRRDEETRRHSERAAAAYERAGAPEMAAYCRESAARDASQNAGDVDAQLAALQKAVAAAPAGSLDRAEALADLGELRLSTGDEPAAEQELIAAERELHEAGRSPLDAERWRLWLEDSFLSEPGTGDAVARTAATRAHELVKRICLLLAFLHRRRDPELSARYLERVRAIVRDEPTPELLRSYTERAERLRQERWKTFEAGLPKLDAMYDKLRQILGPEGQAQIDQWRREGEEGDALNVRIQEGWEEKTRDRPFKIIVDLDRLREAEAQIATENAGLPAGADRSGLLARSEDLEIQARLSQSPDLIAAALLLQARILVAMGRDADADGRLATARATFSDLAEKDLGVYVLALQAEIAARRGDWTAASEVCGQGIAWVEEYRLRVSAPYLQSAYLTSRIALYTLGVRSALELGRWEEMIERADLSKARAILAYLRMARAPSSDAAATERELREVSARIDAEGGSEELEERQHALWERLFGERAHGQRAPEPGTFSLPEVQAALAADEAVLYYYWLDRRTLLVVHLDREGWRHEVRELTEAQRARLDGFNTLALSAAGEAVRALPGSVERARRDLPHSEAPALNPEDILGELAGLLLPETPALAGKRRLLISPHRALHALPFQALPWNGGPLIRSFAVTYVPNLESLTLRYPPPGPPRVLAVGMADGGDLGAPLPMVAREIEGIRNAYAAAGVPVVALLDGEARKDRLRALAESGELSSFTCIHVATHGTNLEEDLPMESSLLLDAELSGEEISGWRLNAEVVALSACWSAKRPTAGRGLEELPGDEMFGLHAAFFMAGAKRIVGSLWPADDEAACAVMTRFHRELAAGAPPEVALQRALIGEIERSGPESLALWAPFSLYALSR